MVRSLSQILRKLRYSSNGKIIFDGEIRNILSYQEMEISLKNVKLKFNNYIQLQNKVSNIP